MANINSLLKSIRKDTGSSSFKDSKYCKVSEWIDTGCYALNRIISGDIYKGIPSGRVIIFSGENSSGKTLITSKVLINALSKHNYDTIFYFDSEGGSLYDFIEGSGVDMDKIEHVLVESVEDAAIKILSIYAKINEFKETNPEYKALCILDSLGNLVTNKLINDAADKGKVVSEMGGRAKIINSLMKGLTIPALKSDTSILVTNHIYDDPSAMFPSKIKNQSGGKGLQYVSSITLQCSKHLEKSDIKKAMYAEQKEKDKAKKNKSLIEDETNNLINSFEKNKEKLVDTDEASYAGNTLTFFTTKNRFVKPFYEADMYIDFSRGIAKYDGLIEAAETYGFIVREGNSYIVPSYSPDKKLKKAAILSGPDSDKIWESFLNEFNEVSKKDMAYSSSELEKIIDEEETPEEKE